VRAVVLVGGQGTRLQPLTFTTPKQMLPVAGRPMIERVVAHLAGHGIDQVVLSLGYRPAAFLLAYPDNRCAGVELTYAVEPEPLDTAGAIGFAARFAGIDETFVVVNGDVITDLHVGALIAFHRRSGAEATVALTPVDDPSRYGVVCTDADGKVTAFIEKPPAADAPTNLINAGTYVLEPEVLERIPGGRRVSVERETFPALAAEGAVFAMASDAYWLDTGTPTAYLRANADLLDGTRPGPPAPGARQVALGVWTLAAPVVRGEVRPYSLLGSGAQIGHGATVTGSVIGARAVVERGAHVENSVLLPGARVGAEARVAGSILGHGAVVAEGCELAPVTVVGDEFEVPAGERLVDARVPEEMAS
jgi:mannose-1-phosphate guanylyltransferase